VSHSSLDGLFERLRGHGSLGQTEFRHWRPSTEGRLRKSIGDIRDSSHAAEFGQLRSQSKLKCLSNSSRSRDSEDLRHKRRVNDHVWRDGVVAECMHPCIARTQR
jgi:hypothetical protein